MYYVMVVRDKAGGKYEQVLYGEGKEEVQRRLQEMCGARFVVEEPREYFGGYHRPNSTPFDRAYEGELE